MEVKIFRELFSFQTPIKLSVINISLSHHNFIYSKLWKAELDAHEPESENSDIPEISEEPIEHEPGDFSDQDAAVKRRKAARHDAPRSKHLPKVIIIGVKKCGTTALSRYMHIHPDLSQGIHKINLLFAGLFSRVDGLQTLVLIISLQEK